MNRLWKSAFKQAAPWVFAIVGVFLVLVILIKMGKPSVIIETGIYYPKEEFGIHVADKMNILDSRYSFKATVSNLYGFSVESYKQTNPEDVIVGRGRNSRLLTNDAASLVLKVKAMGYKWVRFEFLGSKGESIGVVEMKYLGIL